MLSSLSAAGLSMKTCCLSGDPCLPPSFFLVVPTGSWRLIELLKLAGLFATSSLLDVAAPSRSLSMIFLRAYSSLESSWALPFLRPSSLPRERDLDLLTRGRSLESLRYLLRPSSSEAIKMMSSRPRYSYPSLDSTDDSPSSMNLTWSFLTILCWSSSSLS